VLVELSVMEQRYQAVLAVVQDGWKVVEVARRLGVSRQNVHASSSPPSCLGAGIFLPAIPSLCTLKLGYRLHPELMNHRLGTCCEAAGLVHGSPHSAIEDARAPWLRRGDDLLA
jgi:hypothetical protein